MLKNKKKTTQILMRLKIKVKIYQIKLRGNFGND